jgi:hypothetical protein
MTSKARTTYNSERQAQLSAVKDIARRQPAPHAAASLRIGLVVLALWLVLVGGVFVLLAVTRDLRLADALGRALPIPAVLLWLASAVGFARGMLALIQTRGAKGLALTATVLNGLLCLGPLVAILLRLG